jgi:hypothetical protein
MGNLISSNFSKDMVTSSKELYVLYCTRKEDAIEFLNKLLHDDEFSRPYFDEPLFLCQTIFGKLPTKTSLLNHIVSLNDYTSLNLILGVVTKSLEIRDIVVETYDSLLFTAVSFNSYECTKILIRLKDVCDTNSMISSLRYAAKELDVRSVKILLRHKRNRLYPGTYFEVLRKFLCINPPKDTNDRECEKIVRLLLNVGALKVRNPETAVVSAMYSKHSIKIIKLLLNHGADPMKDIDNDVTTPLYIAVVSKRGYFSVMAEHIFKEKVVCESEGVSCGRAVNAFVQCLGNCFYNGSTIPKHIMIILSVLEYVSNVCTCGNGKVYKPLVAAHIPVIARFNNASAISNLNMLLLAGIRNSVDRRANERTKHFVDNFIENITLFEILEFNLAIRQIQDNLTSS